ncbi:hypothetical protein [Helicobacter sp. T3_23-1056]
MQKSMPSKIYPYITTNGAKFKHSKTLIRYENLKIRSNKWLSKVLR